MCSPRKSLSLHLRINLSVNCVSSDGSSRKSMTGLNAMEVTLST